MLLTEMMRKYDTENQFQVLIESYKQIEYAWSNNIDLSTIERNKIKNIILTGLGGSAIGGDLLQNYLRTELKYPFLVNRNYELPSFANQDTLVIASSYSGNTEETLSAANQAIENGCQVICITTGGKLEDFAKKYNLPVGKLLKGFQPRYALWVNFFTLLKIVQYLKLVSEQDDVVINIIDLLKKKGELYSQPQNEALEFAESLVGYLPLVYAVSDYTSAVGTRLKGQLNENSKQHSFFGLLPELDHNEIIGWQTFQSKQINAKLINIIDEEYHSQVKKRFEITTELVKKAGCEVINLQSKEKNPKLRLIDLIYLGDWISYYLAVIREQDPTSIENINYLKERL